MEPLQPSSQNLPRGGIYPLQKKQCKFDFRSACRKTPKTTAFMCILTLISGISYIKSSFFCISVEFTFAKWNSVLQSGIYFCNSPFFDSARVAAPERYKKGSTACTSFIIWQL